MIIQPIDKDIIDIANRRIFWKAGDNITQHITITAETDPRIVSVYEKLVMLQEIKDKLGDIALVSDRMLSVEFVAQNIDNLKALLILDVQEFNNKLEDAVAKATEASENVKVYGADIEALKTKDTELAETIDTKNNEVVELINAVDNKLQTEYATLVKLAEKLTKSEADVYYEDKGHSYSKEESDEKYLKKSDSVAVDAYTKQESDDKFEVKDNGYSKTASDERYAHKQDVANTYATKEELAQAQLGGGSGDNSAAIEQLQNSINAKLGKDEAEGIYAKISQIPRVEGLLSAQTAEETYLKKADKPNIDNLATKAELENFATKEQIPDVSGFITQTQGDERYELKSQGGGNVFNTATIANLKIDKTQGGIAPLDTSEILFRNSPMNSFEITNIQKIYEILKGKMDLDFTQEKNGLYSKIEPIDNFTLSADESPSSFNFSITLDDGSILFLILKNSFTLKKIIKVLPDGEITSFALPYDNSTKKFVINVIFNEHNKKEIYLIPLNDSSLSIRKLYKLKTDRGGAWEEIPNPHNLYFSISCNLLDSMYGGGINTSNYTTHKRYKLINGIWNLIDDSKPNPNNTNFSYLSYSHNYSIEDNGNSNQYVSVYNIFYFPIGYIVSTSHYLTVSFLKNDFIGYKGMQDLEIIQKINGSTSSPNSGLKRILSSCVFLNKEVIIEKDKNYYLNIYPTKEGTDFSYRVFLEEMLKENFYFSYNQSYFWVKQNQEWFTVALINNKYYKITLNKKLLKKFNIEGF